MHEAASKWAGLPLWDQPLGKSTPDDDDGRPVEWLTDFSVATPADRVSANATAGQWSLIDYETPAFRGKLLHAPRNRPADEVNLKLNVTGWYAVYVWLMGGDVDLEKQYPADFDSVYSMSNGPTLSLTGDATASGMFRTMTHDRMMWRGLEACFWRYADLTDATLTIRHQGATVYLGAIQMIPLSPAEVAAVQRDRDSPANKRLILKGDHYAPSEITPMIEQLRGRDVEAWISGSEDSADIFSDPPGSSPKMQAVKAAARELDAQWYACDRPSLWSLHMHWDDPRAAWFAQHPEYHCRERDGTATHQASYAVPQVREYMLERAAAVAANGPDGFGYFFNRDPGLVWFEPAAMEGFQEAHGIDPLTLDDRDDRLLQWRADIITGYLRDVRKVLDESAARHGHARIKMVHVVLGDEAANRAFSFDIARWLADGLIDVMLVYPWVDYPDRWLAQGFAGMDLNYFTTLAKDTPCKVYPMWLSGMWRTHWTPEHVRTDEYFTRAMRDYADGADGISTWDGVGLHLNFQADRWLRLGHKERLAEWAARDFPLPPKVLFNRFAGATPDRFPVGTGG